MSRSVEQMIDDVIRREGGYVDHPRDRGGPTKFGITQSTLSRHLGRPASADDVRGLTPDVAADIYRRYYYEAPGLDLLPQSVQPFVFDAAVNNTDRKAGHLIPVPGGHVYGVDHGVTFSAVPKLRTVLWGWRGTPFDAGETAVLRSLRSGLDGRLGDELRELLSAWRDAKRSARQAVVGWMARVLLALLLIGLAVRFNLTELVTGA